MANQTKDTIRLHHVTTKEGMFHGSEIWSMKNRSPLKMCDDFLTARVSMLFKSRASPDMLPFSPCNKKRLAFRHMNRPLFPTALTIPSYDIGNYVGLRNYQLPLVIKGVTCGCMLCCTVNCKYSCAQFWGVNVNIVWIT
jgi:hypothetical protein